MCPDPWPSSVLILQQHGKGQTTLITILYFILTLLDLFPLCAEYNRDYQAQENKQV
jgi:hypothetical protein